MFVISLSRTSRNQKDLHAEARRRGEIKSVGAIHELPATFHHADTFGRFVNRPYGWFNILSFFDII